jgi:ribonuclease P protein component
MTLKSFGKVERLNSKKNIQELFTKGSSFYLYPFKVLVLPNQDQNTPYHQLLISVSKRNFKRAVDRNTIKRRIREGYRLQKEQLKNPSKLLICYLYIAKEILSSSEIHKSILASFKKLRKPILKDYNQSSAK